MSIDLNYRPESYGDFDRPLAAVLNGIPGQARRGMVAQLLDNLGEGCDFDEEERRLLLDEVSQDKCTPEFRQALTGLFGPQAMGGEYLPGMRHGEVEIARVVLDSSTLDVFSVRARWQGGRYHYSMEGEYDAEFYLCQETSRRPLKLRALIDIIQTVEVTDMDIGDGGFVSGWWDQQLEHGDDPEVCTEFAWVESNLYPELASWYSEYAEQWCLNVEASR